MCQSNRATQKKKCETSELKRFPNILYCAATDKELFVAPPHTHNTREDKSKHISILFSRSSISGAIASTEVKLKLQEFLLSKKEPGPGGLNHSFPQKCW